MDNNLNKETFIVGKPVKTDFCEVRFLKYHEYIEHMPELSNMTFNVLHLYYQYKKMNIVNDKEFDDALEELKKNSLYNIVLNTPWLKDAYIKVFKLVIEEDDVLQAIMDNEEIFMEYRQLVLDMQMLNESEVSSNPEIQEFIDAGREVAQQNSESPTYSDILSSIVVGTGIDYDIILNWTVLRVNATYYRLAAFKNSDVTALYSTVTDKIKYESWQKKINLWHTEKSGIKMSEFNKSYGSLFK